MEGNFTTKENKKMLFEIVFLAFILQITSLLRINHLQRVSCIRYSLPARKDLCHMSTTTTYNLVNQVQKNIKPGMGSARLGI